MTTQRIQEATPGYWIKDQILEAYPDLMVKKIRFKGEDRYGADINENGRIEENELMDDFDEDGYLGTVEDFVTYFEKNRPALTRKIPFFAWAVSMDPENFSPYNPIHDYLNISSKFVPTDDVRDVYRTLEGMITGARLYAIPDMEPAQIAGLIYRELEREGMKYGSMILLSNAINKRRIDSNLSSYLVMGAAHQMGIDDTDEITRWYDDGTSLKQDTYRLYAEFYFDHGLGMKFRGDMFESLRLFEQARLINPQHSEIYHHLARVMRNFAKGKDDKIYDEVISLLDQAMIVDPNDAVARTIRGDVRFDQGRMKDALKEYTLAILDHSTYAPAYVGRGRAWFQLKEYKRAHEDYDSALARDSINASAYYHLGYLFETQKQLEKALKNYTRACKYDPTFAQARHSRAVVLHGLGRYAEAVRDYTRALRLDPMNPTIHHDLATLYFETKDNDKALASLNKSIDIASAALAASPQSAEEMLPTLNSALTRRSAYLIQREEYLKARSDLTKMIELNPKDAKPRIMRGDLYVDLKQYDTAKEDYVEAVKRDPKSAPAYTGLGVVLYLKDNNVEALTHLTKATEIDPKYAPAFFHMGEVWRKIGKWNKAGEAYTKTVDIDKNHAKAYFNRSIVRKELDDIQGSNEDRAIACKIDDKLCK